MSFFQQLAAMNLVGDLKLIVKSTGEQMTVSVLLDNSQCGDAAKNVIPPLVLNGTAQELDEGFFATIDQPIKKVSGLQVQMESYLKQVSTAEAQSKMKADAKKKFDDAIKQVDALIEKKNFREALAKLPKATDYPDMAKPLDAKRNFIMGKMNGGQSSLFDTPSLDAADASTTDSDSSDEDMQEELEEELEDDND